MTGPTERTSPEVTSGPELPWEESAEVLYERAPCGYLSTLPDGTIVRVNETFLAWTGYTRAELIGRRRFQDLLAAGGRIYYETHFSPLLRMQGQVDEIAFDVVRADGRRLHTLVNSSLSRDAGGAPRAVRITVFNATERRRYEQELLAARRAAEASENRVRLLQQAVAGLAASATAQDVAQALVGTCGAAFAAADVAVWLVDSERGRLRRTGSTAPEDGFADLPLSSALPFAEVVRRADLLVLDCAQTDSAELAEWLRQRGRRTLLLAPLTANDAVLGVLALSFAEPREFADGELRLARLLGHQAGQALDRARLYDEARHREARALFIAETTRVLTEAPEVLSRAQRLVAHLVPGYASWAQLRARADQRVLAEAGAAPADAARLAEDAAVVAATGQPAVVAGPQARIAMPLTVRGEVLGTLAVLLTEDRPADSELPFLHDLAGRAALALDGARLYEQQRHVAETLQRSLLAGEPPRHPRLAVDAHYRAATQGVEVGGDWYDTFPINDDKVALVVGDVVGRGIEAASTMGQLRSAIRALAAAELGPADLVDRLDRFVARTPRARMATVAYAEITLSTGELTYACAGHLPPLLLSAGAEPVFLWGGRSVPLGAQAGSGPRPVARAWLPAGARLLLYTDGLIERRDRTLDDGFERLAAGFGARWADPLTGVAARLADDLVGPDRRDDVCLLCLEFGAASRLDRVIPAEPTRIALVRADLRTWLVAHDIDEDSREALLLACSEVVANAIEHGYGRDARGVVTVAAEVTPTAVLLSVSDRGAWRPARFDPVRGRGLYLVERVMDEVIVDRAEGTSVRMRRRTSHRPEQAAKTDP